MIRPLLTASIVLAAGCAQPRYELVGAIGLSEPVCELLSLDFPRRRGAITLADGYVISIVLPRYPDLWQRAVLSRTWSPPDRPECVHELGATETRLQWSREAVTDPDCPDCPERYHALFVNAVVFPAVEACSSCIPYECRAFDGAAFDGYYAWCLTPDEVP